MSVVDSREMIYVEGGPFFMGSWEYGPEFPLHIETVEPFHIDRYPVTNRQYTEFILDAGHEVPRYWFGNTYPADKADHPVQMVSWYDAQAYAQWAGMRLPTEAEWEKAARGTDGRRWPWGNEFSEERTVVRENSPTLGVTTVSVFSYPGGQSPYGVMHMAGNVEEWVADWYEAYPDSTYSSPCFGGKYKVLKGGSYHFTQQYARCAYRRADTIDTRGFSGFAGPGFRCACSAEC